MTKVLFEVKSGRSSAVLPLKPQQRRSRERVAELLEAAEEMLMEEGLAAFSLPRLAARTGIPRAGIYRYFPSPEALLLALAERYLEERERLIPAAWGDAADWREGLRNLILGAAGYYASRPAAQIVLLNQGLSADIAKAYSQTVERLAQSVRDLFETQGGLQVGHQGDPDPYQVVIELVTAMFSLSVRRHEAIVPSYVEQAIRVSETYLENQCGS